MVRVVTHKGFHMINTHTMGPLTGAAEAAWEDGYSAAFREAEDDKRCARLGVALMYAALQHVPKPAAPRAPQSFERGVYELRREHHDKAWDDRGGDIVRAQDDHFAYILYPENTTVEEGVGWSAKITIFSVQGGRGGVFSGGCHLRAVDALSDAMGRVQSHLCKQLEALGGS